MLLFLTMNWYTTNFFGNVSVLLWPLILERNSYCSRSGIKATQIVTDQQLHKFDFTVVGRWLCLCTQVLLSLASGVVPVLAAGLQVAPVLWGRVVMVPAL